MTNERTVHELTFEGQSEIIDISKHRIYYPYLSSLSEGALKRKNSVIAVASNFEMTYEEWIESKSANRYNFVTVDCNMAGFVNKVGHGIHELTETGLEVFNLLQRFDQYNQLDQTVTIMNSIDGRYPTVEKGLDVLSELQALADRVLPKDSEEDSQEARIKSLENKVELLTAELAEIKALLKS